MKVACSALYVAGLLVRGRERTRKMLASLSAATTRIQHKACGAGET